MIHVASQGIVKTRFAWLRKPGASRFHMISQMINTAPNSFGVMYKALNEHAGL
jgi:hypothetical protein